MAHTPFLQIVPQRHKTDCAVACLAMLLGVPYEKALLAVRVERVLTHGVMVRQVLHAAKRLGKPLQFHRKFDLEADTGILGVRAESWPLEHLVVLREGVIVDTDSMLWDAPDFLDFYDAKAISLLTL